MNATITQEKSNTQPATQRQRFEVPVKPTTPPLDSIVQAIRMDASKDSLKYVLRSDTGHDGE